MVKKRCLARAWRANAPPKQCAGVQHCSSLWRRNWGQLGRGQPSVVCSLCMGQGYPWPSICTACALRGHCVRTACILRTQRPGYSPKNTCHLTGCTAKQQSPHENDETAFNLVLHCPYEQTTQPCKVRLLQVFRCPWLRSWKRMRCSLTRSAGNALSVVSWVMGTANRVKGRAVVILSVDATHLLMASEISDVVGMKAVPQNPQGPRAMYGYITPAFSGSQ